MYDCVHHHTHQWLSVSGDRHQRLRQRLLHPVAGFPFESVPDTALMTGMVVSVVDSSVVMPK